MGASQRPKAPPGDCRITDAACSIAAFTMRQGDGMFPEH